MHSIATAYKLGLLKDFFKKDFSKISFDKPKFDEYKRKELCIALRDYHEELGILNQKTEILLNKLEQNYSWVCVTGQQAGLLTGPSYSVHKGVDAILCAEKFDAVPVYWVASQDHDIDEINWAALLDMQGNIIKTHFDLPEKSVGKIFWQPNYTKILRELVENFDSPRPYKKRVLDILERSTQDLNSGRKPSWADVFSRMIFYILEQKGILMLDPTFEPIAKLMVPDIKFELENPLESSKIIEECAEKLINLGYHPALRRPKNATNLFLDKGKRELLRFDNGFFYTQNNKYTKEELFVLLDEDPKIITPAAGLRPIIQDSLLPTLSFSVGDGEISYIAQIKDIYNLHGVEQPYILPRLKITWIEPNIKRILNKYNISASTFQANPKKCLVKKFIQKRQITVLENEYLDEINENYQKIIDSISSIHPNLEKYAQKTSVIISSNIKKLQEKAIISLAYSEEVFLEQQEKLKKYLLPNEKPQERYLSFFTFLLKHGSFPVQKMMQQKPGSDVELDFVSLELSEK